MWEELKKEDYEKEKINLWMIVCLFVIPHKPTNNNKQRERNQMFTSHGNHTPNWIILVHLCVNSNKNMKSKQPHSLSLSSSTNDLFLIEMTFSRKGNIKNPSQRKKTSLIKDIKNRCQNALFSHLFRTYEPPNLGNCIWHVPQCISFHRQWACSDRDWLFWVLEWHWEDEWLHLQWNH